MTRSILCVVAHPDDEVLGFGGSAYALSSGGDSITSCILVGDADARSLRPGVHELRADMKEASRIVGMHEPLVGPFPNIKLNTVPHLDLVQFIEDAIVDFSPDIVVTHHSSDVNIDHLQVSVACQAAVRLPQRQPELKPIGSLLFMEVLSSTDWSFSGGALPFQPNAFVEIGESGVEAKLEALSAYREVMRPHPHPRSVESVRALATLRGSSSGFDFAEAFEVGMHRVPKSA